MTGFGKVTAELPSKKVTVEIKALNSKQLGGRASGGHLEMKPPE